MCPGTGFASEQAAHQQYTLAAGSPLWVSYATCSRRKGCHPLLILKTQFLLLEADSPCMPPATGAGGRHRCSSWVGNREAVPRPMEAPQSHLLFPRQAKMQLSRASCCRAPRFPEAKFPPRSLVKCPSSDGPQPPAWAPWEGRQSPGLQSPSGELAAALAFHSLLVLKGQG